MSPIYDSLKHNNWERKYPAGLCPGNHVGSQRTGRMGVANSPPNKSDGDGTSRPTPIPSSTAEQSELPIAAATR